MKYTYFIITLFTYVLAAPGDDYFDEELLIKPLPTGHIYAYLQFTTIWDVDLEARSFHHTKLFPRALGEIIGRYEVQELHLSLTSGLWTHENWGYPVIDAPPGAELWAWFKHNADDVEANWVGLTGSLSGLLCASLNFIDASKSLSPEFSFRPTGLVSQKQLNSSYLRYATLPREIVCTENLTPWKKLLPCDSKRGLASLLNAGHIYNTNYHSLGIHLRSVCRDTSCSESSVELRQSVSLVYDLPLLGNGNNRDWSIRKLFGTGLGSACPLAAMSNAYVDISQNQTLGTFSLTPEPSAVITSIRGGTQSKFAVYDVRALSVNNTLFNIAATYSQPRVFTLKKPPILYANRYIIGYGQEQGGIVTKIRNNYRQPVDIIFFDNIPWYLPIYLHTLKVISNGERIRPVVRYRPGQDRQRPYYLEVALRLPPRSVTEISIQFEYMFLKWQEYPPDANHGFYVGAAVITAYLPIARNYTGLPQEGSTITSSFNASREGYLVQLRTEVLIVTLPTPDFSMPYNVICLACTVVALAFGPLHNITTKKLLLRPTDYESGPIAWIKGRFRTKKEKKD